LVDCFGLAEHGGGHHFHSPFAGDHLGSSQKDLGPVFGAEAVPFGARLQTAADSIVDCCSVGVVESRKFKRMIKGSYLVFDAFSSDFFVADYDGDVEEGR